ncbi:MAG: hypothetical protein ACTHLC_08950, partial [Rhizobiaceae bacterium]
MPIHPIALALVAAGLLGSALSSAGAADISIGLAAPLSGPSQTLGEQLRGGVETAAANHAGATVTLETA